MTLLCTILLCILWRPNLSVAKRVHERKEVDFNDNYRIDIGSDFLAYDEDVGKGLDEETMQEHSNHKDEESKGVISHPEARTPPYSNEFMQEYNQSIRQQASIDDTQIKEEQINCTRDGWINFSILWQCWDDVQGMEFIWLMTKVLVVFAAIIGLLASCLWCTKGWCCCCCPCNFCKVSQRLMEAQLYVAQNPPGVCQQDGLSIHYTPTDREVMLYEKITNYLVDI